MPIREANNLWPITGTKWLLGTKYKQPLRLNLDQTSRQDTQRGDLAQSKPMTEKVFLGPLTVNRSAGYLSDIAFRRSAVFWTIFTLAILLWMVGLAASFGPGVMPLLLVLGTILA